MTKQPLTLTRQRRAQLADDDAHARAEVMRRRALHRAERSAAQAERLARLARLEMAR